MVAEQLDIHGQKNQLQSKFHTYKNSKYMTDLNVKLQTLFRKSHGGNIQNLGLQKEFLELIPKT